VGSLPPEDGYYMMKEGGRRWKKLVLGFELVEERRILYFLYLD
jgi:hypothetical protein